jgi:Ca2+-binding EF-hand superfamily protein
MLIFPRYKAFTIVVTRYYLFFALYNVSQRTRSESKNFVPQQSSNSFVFSPQKMKLLSILACICMQGMSAVGSLIFSAQLTSHQTKTKPNSMSTLSPGASLRQPNPGNVKEVEADLAAARKYPSVAEYYMASSTNEQVPITYQSGLSNYSSMVLGDDRIMFKESLMTADFRPSVEKCLDEEQLRSRAKPLAARKREYIDAVRAVGWDEVDRMERNIRDKLNQRSFATSSPFQVRKSFKFFDTEKNGTLDTIGLTRALVFLGFEFSAKQALALFARYDTELMGTVDYMRIYKTCMEKNDDAPPIIPDVSHLGDNVNFDNSRPVTASLAEAFADTSTASTDGLVDVKQVEINRIFSMLDKVGNNSIAESDFEILLLALNIALAPQELDDERRNMCSPTDMRIHFKDFFPFYKMHAHTHK